MAWPATRSTRARCTPTCLPRLRAQAAGRARRHLPAVRHPQRPHAGGHLPTGGPQLLRRPVRVPVPARHGRAAVRAGGGPVTAASWAAPAASTPRWARTKPCWPTWCAACWKTAPTPRSSTALPTSRAAGRAGEDPVAGLQALAAAGRAPACRTRRIPLPRALYGTGRANSQGLDLANEQQLPTCRACCKPKPGRPGTRAAAGPRPAAGSPAQPVRNPADHQRCGRPGAAKPRGRRRTRPWPGQPPRRPGPPPRPPRRDALARRRPAGSAHASSCWAC
jgi:hypothetical protein